MAGLPEAVSALVAELGKLPGIGPRSAERLALHLVQTDLETVRHLATAIVAARERVGLCSICGGLAEQPVCRICDDSRRDVSLLCVVEKPIDILSIEKSGIFRGKYHVLGGKISPVNGIGPDDIRIAQLESNLDRFPVTELIIALGSDVEGDATSHYLAQRLSPRGVKITRLAHGIPVGSSLEFADELTLSRAIEGRRTIH